VLWLNPGAYLGYEGGAVRQVANYDGITESVVKATRQALEWGQPPANVLAHGLVAGMDLVGQDFGAGILFVPEVLRAANAMKAAMEILRPPLTQTGAARIGTAVIGTVKGDIHDIGKNLVGMMWEGAGFEVINLGVNVDADKFLAAIRQHNANLLGMSTLLTTTMPYMATVIERLEQEGQRGQVRVLVGGAPLNAAFAEDVRTDAYCKDAAEAVTVAKALFEREMQDASVDIIGRQQYTGVS
jgi:5-methyltetrahydrofolate--homocysteine methyltransferase